MELLVVMSILITVIGIAGGALISLLQASNRSDARVSQEQTVSTTLADLARDIRSAHAINAPTSGNTSTQLQLQLNNQSGGPTTVQWTYDSTAATLTRQVLDGSGNPVSTGWVLTRVVNPPSTPVFRYFNDQGTDISSSQTSAIVSCSVRVNVQLQVGSSQSVVPEFGESEDVSLTDQVEILSAPGNGQC